MLCSSENRGHKTLCAQTCRAGGTGFQLYPGPTSLYIGQYLLKKEEMFVKFTHERYNRLINAISM